MMKLLRSYDLFDYSPDMIKESREKNNGKIIMKGILQKADTLNQNGRIYPSEILEREIRNYQKLILENRALGECVPAGTGIYTQTGWKNIEDVVDGESIYTLNVKTNELQLQPINYTIKKMYNDDLIRISNKRGSIDMTLTKGHKVVLWDRNDESYVLTAEEIYTAIQNNDPKVSHSHIRRSGDWTGETPQWVNIQGSNKQVDSHIWAGFLGIYLAEGHACGTLGGKKCNLIAITQKKPAGIEKIRTLLAQMPFKFIERKSANGKVQFQSSDPNLYNHLFCLGYSHTKHIPNYAKNWSPQLQNILLEWMLLGDGRNRKNRGKLLREYYTTSPKLAEDVYEIMLKLGNGATTNVRYQKDRIIEGRVIKRDNSKPLYIVSEHTSNGAYLDARFIKAEKIKHNDYVYCVNVKNSTWLMKNNNATAVTHNCDHPDNSVISLKNVSHVIREAYLEGNVVYGTVELLDTPSGKILQSLVEQGIKLGISSRGVGSTSRDAGYDVVQDDFQLICWDFVSEPSTPGAFMMKEGREFTREDLKKVFTKSDRVDRILNEILSAKK